MREILFRGKRDEIQEWVEGDLLIDSCKDVSIRADHCTLYYDIIPETVGQYTGLTDKNGKKIFEGDIVKIRGEIRYIFYGISSFRHTNYGEYAAELRDVNTGRECEIIGNIHDNPELLNNKENDECVNG